MSPHDVSSTVDGDAVARKRVCKACDRCRLKKSKCDGTTPCGRCRADNAICVFGERKKSHDKVYPKGYVEMLEQQQVQLVNGLHELYKLVLNGQAWEGPLLNDSGNCRPLTHDILDSLGVLQSDNQSNSGGFEDDLDMMQQRLLANGLDFSHRRDSPDSVTERNPMNSSFLEPTLQQQFSEDGLNAVSLSTPPTTQTPSMNSSWRTSNKSSPVRPHSLQLHSRYSTSHADMISTSLNEQPFYNSPMTYEEGIEFLKLNTLMNLDNASGLQQCSTPMEMTIPTSTLSTWNEEDFTSFLNSTLG